MFIGKISMAIEVSHEAIRRAGRDGCCIAITCSSGDIIGKSFTVIMNHSVR